MSKISTHYTTFYQVFWRLFFSIFLVTSSLLLSIQSGRAQISGIAFKDFNANGSRQVASGTPPITEPLLAGITVTATLASGTVLTTTTSALGAYSFTAAQIPSGTAVRIEFSMLPPGYADGFSGITNSTNSSTVRFLTAGASATNIDLAVNTSADYCQSNPPVLLTYYVAGTGTATDRSMATLPYTASSTGGGNQSVPPTGGTYYSSTGTVWGAAYQASTKSIFSAAFMKRHAAFGPSGTGAIYKTDYNNFGAVTGTSVYVNFSTLGIPTGTDSHNNNYNDLTTTVPTAQNPFDDVGKIGFGDLDISDDGKYLFVTNLFDRKVYRIFTDNPAKPTITAADVTVVADFSAAGLAALLPTNNPSCTNGDFRPFGLGFKNGKLYVGGVCTGQTGTVTTGSNTVNGATNLYSHIFEIANVLTTPSAPVKINTIPLNYLKGCADHGAGCNNNMRQWYPWTSNGATTNAAIIEGTVYPQPMVSDIEFDVDGSIVIALMDRYGHQAMISRPYTNNMSSQFPILSGDILRICNTGTLNVPIYATESNGRCGTAGSGANGQGPGGGEFYGGDKIPNENHQETVMGGIAILPGTGEVTVALMDPFDYVSSGIGWLSNTTGAAVRKYEILPMDFNRPVGKGAALGDMVVLCDASPIEIGNRVWNDLNGDGIQDVNEPPLVGVTLTLYASDGLTVVGTAITDAFGQYNFNQTNVVDTLGAAKPNNLGPQPNMNYTIKVTNLGTNPSVLNMTLNSITPGGTPGETGGINSGLSLLNNDATLVGGFPTISLTTGNIGSNNHSYDFGFKVCVKPNRLIQVTNPTCTLPGKIELISSVNGTRYGIQNAAIYTAPLFASSTTIPSTLPAIIKNNISNAVDSIFTTG